MGFGLRLLMDSSRATGRRRGLLQLCPRCLPPSLAAPLPPSALLLALLLPRRQGNAPGARTLQSDEDPHRDILCCQTPDTATMTEGERVTPSRVFLLIGNPALEEQSGDYRFRIPAPHGKKEQEGNNEISITDTEVL